MPTLEPGEALSTTFPPPATVPADAVAAAADLLALGTRVDRTARPSVAARDSAASLLPRRPPPPAGPRRREDVERISPLSRGAWSAAGLPICCWGAGSRCGGSSSRNARPPERRRLALRVVEADPESDASTAALAAWSTGSEAGRCLLVSAASVPEVDGGEDEDGCMSPDQSEGADGCFASARRPAATGPAVEAMVEMLFCMRRRGRRITPSPTTAGRMADAPPLRTSS